MSTGYPNNETGHPTTFYTYVHQNPQVLVGEDAYPYGDPNAFLEAHRFITAELAEALRRSNPEASGILHGLEMYMMQILSTLILHTILCRIR